MGHRLLEKYPSLCSLCRFDFSRLKEELSRIAAEDISGLGERALISRMETAYQALRDENIMTSKAPNSGKICYVSEAAFISFPCGFYDGDGREIRLYMLRAKKKDVKFASFRFHGFGTAMIHGDSAKYAEKTELDHNQIIRAKRVTPRTIESSLIKEIEELQIEIADGRTRAQLVIRELTDMREKLMEPLPEPEKLTLFARLKKRIRAIIGF